MLSSLQSLLPLGHFPVCVKVITKQAILDATMVRMVAVLVVVLMMTIETMRPTVAVLMMVVLVKLRTLLQVRKAAMEQTMGLVLLTVLEAGIG